MLAERTRFARWRRFAWFLFALIPPLFLLSITFRPHDSRSSTPVVSDFRNFESLQVHPLAITPDGTKLLALNTPDARLEVFERSGHYPFVEEPRRFARLVGEFLATGS